MTDETITVTLKLDMDDLAAQFRAAADALTSDRYAANEARQRESGATHLHGATLDLNRPTGPDPLDEDDHRDRMTRDGYLLTRNGPRHWHLGSGNPVPCPAAHVAGRVSLDWWDVARGPLAFAPDASPAPQDAAQSAAESEDDAVEGGGPAGPPEALLCHECGHDIEQHVEFGCYQPADGETPECSCTQSVTDIARHRIAKATS